MSPGVVALGEADYEVVDVSLLSAVDDLLPRHLVTVHAVCDVLLEGEVEEDGLLGHDADLGSDPGHVQSVDVVILE